jgi:hypothetical protein
MTDPARKAIATAILDEYGTTFCEELKIHIEHNTPSPLFQLFAFSLLAGTTVCCGPALAASRLLFDNGWTTVKKTAGADRAAIAALLERAEFQGASGAAAESLVRSAGTIWELYGGDMRTLREAGEHDPDRVRRLLLELSGMTDEAVEMFFREVQPVWGELYPYAGSAALEAAARLELGGSAEELAALVEYDEFTRFVCGLVRVKLRDQFESVLARL